MWAPIAAAVDTSLKRFNHSLSIWLVWFATTRPGGWVARAVADLMRDDDAAALPPPPTIGDEPVVHKALLLNHTRKKVKKVEHVPADVLNTGGIGHVHGLVDKCRSSAPTDWSTDDDVVVEIRYTLGKRKYRALFRRGTDVGKVVSRMRVSRDMGVHVGVSRAVLLDPGNWKLEGENVTVRVSKYMGPNRDCHGVPVRVRDLFPNDDHEENRTNCGALRIKYENGHESCRNYQSDEHIGAMVRMGLKRA